MCHASALSNAQPNWHNWVDDWQLSVLSWNMSGKKIQQQTLASGDSKHQLMAADNHDREVELGDKTAASCWEEAK